MRDTPLPPKQAPARRNRFRLGELLIAPDTNEIDGVRIDAKTMDVLVALADAADSVSSVAQLLERVWPNVVVGDNVVHQAIATLRKALGDDARAPRYLQTIPKRGYRLITTVEWVPARNVERKASASAHRGDATVDEGENHWPSLAAPRMVLSTYPVFVSHAPQDSDLAMEIVVGLEARGIGCFIVRRDILNVDAVYYPEAITRAIRGSRVVVVLLSSSVNAADNVLREVTLALDHPTDAKRLMPIRIDDAKLSDNLSYWLAGLHQLDVRKQHGSTLVEQILQRSRVYLESAAMANPTATAAHLDSVDPGADANAPEHDVLRKRDEFEPAVFVIPAGRFQMGSPLDEPGRFGNERLHEVRIAKFGIGEKPLTRREFRAFLDSSGYTPQSSIAGLWAWDAETGRASNQTQMDWQHPGFEQNDNHPVVGLSWHDAIGYCQWIAERTDRRYRLPSEAEWEYAARGGTSTPFWTGSTLSANQFNFDDRRTTAWGVKPRFRAGTTPVGALNTPNLFGLHDVHGNVWEWVADVWHDSYADAPTDGRPWLVGGDDSLRMMRGGAWFYGPRYARSANRAWLLPQECFNTVGLRIALDLTPL